MKIKRVSFREGASAFFFDDQRAIKAGAGHDGFVYTGKPITPGFVRIRQPGKVICVTLELENGRFAYGDCAAVQYSGAGGRDPLLDPARYIPFLEKHVKPVLEGMELDSFRRCAGVIDNLKVPDPLSEHPEEPKILHTALRYGLTQALLYARAEAAGMIPAEIVAEEWNLPLIASPVPVFGQTGDDRYTNADKMILKGVDALPHGLINNVDEKLGRQGEKLKEYLRWLARRITELRMDPSYKPSLHVDVYGTIGQIFNNDPVRVGSYLASLEKDASPFELYIEGPIDLEHRERQMEGLGAIKRELLKLGSPVKIVADEWCNTLQDIKDFADADSCHMIQIKTPDLGGLQDIVDAVLYCKKAGVEAYQGGTCNETDLSARACVHLAMASRPERMLAKPGMGFDEGYCIVTNEMARICSTFELRSRHA
ncbi:MAG: methylaspartate ammonia-lyase [Treponema sp.]|nr:methylaspartate ammonia-lyase [Treponema sp.]